MGASICESVTRLDVTNNLSHQTYSEMFHEFEGGKIDARFGRILTLFPEADNLFMTELRSYLGMKVRIGK